MFLYSSSNQIPGKDLPNFFVMHIKTIFSTSLLVALLSIIPFQIKAETAPKKVSSTIQKVTVFLNGAQVTRTATVNLVAGTQKISFKELSAELDPSSVQVQADGRLTILSVSSEMFYPEVDEPELPTAEIDKVVAEITELNKKLKLETAMLQALNEAFAKEEALLNQNQRYQGETTGTDLERVKSALALYRNRYAEVTKERYAYEQRINELNYMIGQKNLRLNQLRQQGQRPIPIVEASREVVVTVKASTATSGKFTLIYQVENAGWLPFYDLRAKDVSQPLELTYNARVFQSTGEDWKDVKLTLSTGDPSKSSLAPQLTTWQLDFFTNQRQPVTTSGALQRPTPGMQANGGLVTGRVFDAQTGEGLIGATVVVKGTTVGSIVNMNGEYSIAVPPGGSVLQINYLGYDRQEIAISNRTRIDAALSASNVQLDEVVVMEKESIQNVPRRSTDVLSSTTAGVARTKKVRVKKQTKTIPLIVNPIQKATNVEFEIKEKYSIPNEGKPYTVEMTQYEMEAEYEYFCVPKLDLNAYLTARVSGWEGLNLLEGEANLYFEGTYLGKTLLNVRQVTDTMDISLGRDRNIVVRREKLKDDRKTNLTGKRREARAFEIEVRNQKQQVVRITIEDQFPVSKNEEIEVSQGDYEGAELDELTGKLKWKLELKPKQAEKLKFDYEVKFPKGKSVQLE